MVAIISRPEIGKLAVFRFFSRNEMEFFQNPRVGGCTCVLMYATGAIIQMAVLLALLDERVAIPNRRLHTRMSMGCLIDFTFQKVLALRLRASRDGVELEGACYLDELKQRAGPSRRRKPETNRIYSQETASGLQALYA